MGHGGDKRLGMRVIQAIALAACVGLVFGARQLAPRTSPIVDVITPVGLFLMAGTLAAAVFDGFRIPYLSAYLIVASRAGSSFIS